MSTPSTPTSDRRGASSTSHAAVSRGGRRHRESETRGLSSHERRALALLGLPTFGLALAITMVSTYLPKVLAQYTSSTTVIGVLIAGEGLGALILPVLVGSWSDELRTRFGSRLPFVMAGVPVVVGGLLLMGLVANLWEAAIAAAVFFAGYFVAYEPYRALYPDLVPDDVAGRAQSTQAVWRGAGTGIALLGGGLLLAAGQAVPFSVAAAVVLAACGGFVYLALRWKHTGKEERVSKQSVRETLGGLRDMLLHNRPLRAFFFANALWELALAALKTFIILYLTRGLGVSLTGSAGLVGGTALIILVGAGLSGRLADRYGHHPVMLGALLMFGGGMLVPFFFTLHPLIGAVVPFIALGGGVLLSLPYALLMPLMPKAHHGALTGYYSMSRGLGVVLGPVIAGAVITALTPYFSGTHGYQAMWAICAVAILASIPLLRRIRDER